MSAAMQWAGGITAVLGALAAVWTIGRKAARWFRKISDFVEDWAGEAGRQGVPGRDGVMLRLATSEDTQRRILAELTPNGGGSLRDAVDGLRRDLARHLAEYHGAPSWSPPPPPPAPRGNTYGAPLSERTTRQHVSYVRRH